MKLTGVFLLTACLQVSATAYSQRITLSERNATVEKVFRKIMKQTDYMFLYTDELLENTKKVSIDIKDGPIDKVLEQCFKNQPVTYAIFEKTVIVKPAAKVGETTTAPMPPATITGKVSDEKGESLPGVSIKLKGTSVSGVTNINGEYSIKIPEENKAQAILVFTFLGYERKEVTIGTNTSVNVKMVPEATSLSEVVVIGYGTQRRADVSSAIASVDMAKLKEVPAANLSTALQGRVAGLVSTPSSFRPGSGSNIRIRGNRSFSTADNGPLFVVDGIPITYSIDDINPLDIESIDVLKDASATAIYGSRGANGVIQVTTKKGKNGKLTIDYSGSTSFDNIINKLKIYNGPEFAQFKRDAFIGSGIYNNTLSATNTAKLYYPDPVADYKMFIGDPALWQSVLAGYTFTQLDPANGIFNAVTRPTTPEEQAVMAKLGYPVLLNVAVYDPSKVPTYDWQSQALRTGVTQSHNLSLSGGSDKFTSSFSAGYFNQKGIIPGQDYTRYSFSTNNNFKPVSYINLGANVNYNNGIQNLGSDIYSAAAGQFPFTQPYDAAGNFILFPGNDANVVNPINDVNTVLNEIRTNRLLANTFANVTFFKGLSYRIAFGADMSNSRQGTFNGSQSSASSGNPANASYQSTFNFAWTLQNQLTYNTTIASKHSITATVVQEIQKERSEVDRIAATNLAYETQKWYALQNNTLGTTTSTGSYNERKLVGYLGRFIYSYNSKYIFTVAYRLDQSSVFAEDKKGQIFPGASIAWRINQEQFMKQFEFIDELKLRGGIATVGQQANVVPYLTRGPLNSTPTQYNFGQTLAQGYAPQNLPLPDLSWERTTTKNIALDFSLFKNRITGSIDIYQSTSNNIQKESIPAASGYSTFTINLGEVRNKGVEISVSTVNVNQPKGIRWTTDFSFSTNNESITYLTPTGTDDIGNQWFLGQPIRNYNDFQGHGIFQYADTQPGGILFDYFWKKKGNSTDPNFQPGKIRVDDMNGDTVITSADKVNIGSPNPKWTMGINNTLSYKGFDLSAFVYISHGNILRDIRPGLVGRYESVKVNYWTPTNPSNDYQQPNTLSDIPLYWQALSFRDASFVRVRSILLTYHIPQSILNKLKISNLSLSVNAVNPFLFSKYDRYDPETVPYTSTYPSSSTANPAPTSYSYRSIVFGLKVGL